MAPKQKLKNNHQNDPKYEVSLHLRLKPAEHQFLLEKAEKFGSTLSQAARLLMFKDDFLVAKKAAGNSDPRHQAVLALRGAREEFRRLVDMYETISNTVIEGKTETPEAVKRALFSLENITIEMQKTLNSALKKYDQKEVHLVSKTLAGTTNNDTKNLAENTKKLLNFKLKYCYMERILIVGFLAADANEYEKSGTKRMRFPVLIERRKKGGSSRIIYTVFMEKTDVFEHLKKGVQVAVAGRYSENDNNEKIVFADDLSLFGGVE